MTLATAAPPGGDDPLSGLNRHQRRLWASKKNYAVRDLDLQGAAFRRLVGRLEAYGNALSAAHREALWAIIGRFTMLANGSVSGRFAYDLPCGGGKTQAVIAWCAEVYHRRKPWAVAVCASRVADLCDIKRQLVEQHGVPDGAVGLEHSYSAKHAAFPKTAGNEGRKILLVTHARVRCDDKSNRIAPYRGKPRSLVIWDESLLVSEHRTVGRLPVEQGLGYLRPKARYADPESELARGFAYLDSAWKQLEKELEDQKAQARKPRPVTLPPLSEETLANYSAALGAEEDKEATAEARRLLAISQAPLRVVSANQALGGYIQYDVVVPPQLRRVAILDASWAIRDLEQLDKTIRGDPAFKGDIKRYNNVTIRHLNAPSGRGAITKDFMQRRVARKVSREVVEAVRSIPQGQAVLVFTFRERKRQMRWGKPLNMAKDLQDALLAAGVDTDATLANGKPRFAFLTWGQETATSEYSHCQNVIFAGVLHRSDVDLAGAICGQSGDLLRAVSHEDIIKVRRSEIAHGLYQAMSRGACRNTINGEAARMNVWLIHNDPKVRGLIEMVMPGVVWTDWAPVAMKAGGKIISGLAAEIGKQLETLPPEITKLSTRKLKEVMEAKGASAETWRLSLHAALGDTPGWRLDGRSVARN